MKSSKTVALYNVVFESRRYKSLRRFLSIIKYVVVAVLVHLYALVLITKDWTGSWCRDVKFTVGSVIFGDVVALHSIMADANLFAKAAEKCKALRLLLQASTKFFIFKVIIWMILAGFVAFYVVRKGIHDWRSLIPVWGAALFVTVGYVFSKHRSHISWTAIRMGLATQILCGFVAIRWNPDFFTCISSKLEQALEFTNCGSLFVFGHLVDGAFDGIPQQIPIFAFSSLPVVIFFGFFISVLCYLGAVQFVMLNMGQLMHLTTRITACECMCSVVSVFLGETAAASLIKPYLSEMTLSELHCVMSSGFSGVSGVVFALLIHWGLMYPETEKSTTSSDVIRPARSQEKTIFEAGSNGVHHVMGVAARMAASLIAYKSFLYMIDNILRTLGDLVDAHWSLQGVLGNVFAVISMLMGVDSDEMTTVGYLIGLRVCASEVIAFMELKSLTSQNKLTARGELISIYALCSTSNLSNIGPIERLFIHVAPRRADDIFDLSWRAMFTGCLCSFVNACIASALIE
ncbi:sodium/nucleoside cotransporter 2-like isoform X2 [Ornithodoros turicata]|uniref:sodium/nucleoside cotransporter 2-like isoform X2 n=1 Tax=Ornithodoros turicata TaxID=34597 RepID=UPI003139C536